MPVAARPDPEKLLLQIQAEEKYSASGRLKVFLGYASGVGKSYRMLDEGRRRHERGEDVVVGALQPDIPPEIRGILKTLQVIPLKLIDGQPVMDINAILRRRPQVCLVDGLAYDNPAGSRNAHRWQDVEQLLEAGICVITTINLQFIEERRAEVEAIRGKAVSVTVPEAFLRNADEIVVVDAPAEHSLVRGDQSAPGALANEEERKLNHLREIALLLAAEVVDEQLESYLERHGVTQAWGMQERILVCITPTSNAARMIDRARLTRDRFHGELYVAYVEGSDLTTDERQALEDHLALARNAGAEIQLLDGDDAVCTIMDFARERGITQIFIGHSLSEDWRARLGLTTVDRLIRAADGIDVKLFPH